MLLPVLFIATAAFAQTAPQRRSTALVIPKEGKTGFSLIPSLQTGIAFTNHLAQSRSLTNQIYLNGSGIAAGDVDGDGRCDLYFCGLDNKNELYRNLGNWRFEPITEAAGVACSDQASTGAAFADIDGDNDLDLIVNGIARGTRLFLNDGHAKFNEVTESSGLKHNSGAMSLAIADVNRDGLLDIYVVNYRNSTFRDEPEKRFRVVPRAGKYEITLVDGRPTTEPDLVGRFSADPQLGLMEHGEPDMLFINQGNAKFRRVQWNDGTFVDEIGARIPVPYEWGLSAMFRDLNGDLAPDLYVCNDFQSPDRISLNDGTGKFKAAPANSFRQTSLFSMGVDFADLDGDGREEIFVADMLSRIHERRQTQVMDGTAARVPDRKFETRPQYTRNTLFWNRGNGTYAEIAQLAGLDATEWSWCPAFIDIDLDGRRDLIVTTGHERDAQHIDIAREIDAAKTRKATWREQIDMRKKFPRLDSPIFAFQNLGALQFTNVTANWGFITSQTAHGLALADLDNDGDLDLVANALNSGALVYRNESIQPRIAIRLRGNPPNAGAIGAQIQVAVPGLPLQSDQIFAAGRYLSSDAFTRTFAARQNANASVTIRWPAGGVTQITNLPSNHLLEISENSALPTNPSPTEQFTPLFQDVSAQLKHQHRDEPFDDFQRQILLPRKYSELGPPVCWFDLDGDGWEDLFIGSGRGGKLAAFKNERGTLHPQNLAFSTNSTQQDHTAIAAIVSGASRTLLVASSNYEDASTNRATLRQYNAEGKLVAEYLAGRVESIGTLAAGDADGDGDTDLFVGSRIVPARYPEAPSHVFLRNENGAFTNTVSVDSSFRNAGMVSAATWADLDNDHRPELLLAVDGGPIRVLAFAQNSFHERTSDLGLDQHLGWWQCIATDDFNNDGQIDLAAGNLGRNSKYQKYLPDQYVLFHGEFAGNSTVQIIEAFRDPRTGKHFPLFDRDSLAVNLPELRQRYPTFTAFSTASVEGFLGDRFSNARALRINTTETMVFIRDGKRFRAQALPVQAQFSPAMSIAAADVNSDGKTDLFLSQNLFSVGKDSSRYDAGEGLLLRGNGDGTFEALPSQESGIKMEGEGRGVAFCDFDHDGQIDLVVGQNSGPARLFRNVHPHLGDTSTLPAPPK
ncbi:MAG TPA: VCBS repeat-containing protein [Verrucomicrobiae bacterium]